MFNAGEFGLHAIFSLQKEKTMFSHNKKQLRFLFDILIWYALLN